MGARDDEDYVPDGGPVNELKPRSVGGMTSTEIITLIGAALGAVMGLAGVVLAYLEVCGKLGTSSGIGLAGIGAGIFGGGVLGNVVNSRIVNAAQGRRGKNMSWLKKAWAWTKKTAGTVWTWITTAFIPWLVTNWITGMIFGLAVGLVVGFILGLRV